MKRHHLWKKSRGKRGAAAVLCLALCAAGLSACGSGTGSSGGNAPADEAGGGDGQPGGSLGTGDRESVVVVMGPTSEPEAGFDPAYGWGAGEHVHEPLIQSTLTVTTADLEIGYDLATDMQVSEDGLTWTVDIRDDVKFTDGEPLTAEDVAFTYNTLRDTSSVNDFTMLEEAVAVDGDTVEFLYTLDQGADVGNAGPIQ